MGNPGDRGTMGEPLSVMVVQLPHARDMPLPAYHSKSAAGLDLTAAVLDGYPLTLKPGDRALVPTGLVLQIPEGHEGQVRPRSGIALRHGVTVLNSPGTIDADYRGEVMVALVNHGESPFVVERGMRIAQLLVAPVPRVTWSEVDELPPSVRGEGGFGHTGTR
jgi:dUTP pyrophosphatase